MASVRRRNCRPQAIPRSQDFSIAKYINAPIEGEEQWCRRVTHRNLRTVTTAPIHYYIGYCSTNLLTTDPGSDIEE